MSMFGNICNGIGKIVGSAATSAATSIKQSIGKLTPEEAEKKWQEFCEKVREKNFDANSLVDILKFLGIRSDIGSRVQLAKELHLQNTDQSDSAAMNIGLLKAFKEQFIANGGQAPSSFGQKA